MDRQKVIFFCNALETLVRYPDVVETGPDWNRSETRAASEEALAQAESDLEIESRNAACSQ